MIDDKRKSQYLSDLMKRAKGMLYGRAFNETGHSATDSSALLRKLSILQTGALRDSYANEDESVL